MWRAFFFVLHFLEMYQGTRDISFFLSQSGLFRFDSHSFHETFFKYSTSKPQP